MIISSNTFNVSCQKTIKVDVFISFEIKSIISLSASDTEESIFPIFFFVVSDVSFLRDRLKN